MTSSIIIAFCILLLIAYVFDLTAGKTRIPSVILLLLLGWGLDQLSLLFNIRVPNFAPLLPVLGSIGFILIVLEGSLELELNRSKIKLIIKSFLGALFPILILSFYYGHYGLRISLINAIPLCVISSSVAIPSSKHLPQVEKEFVTYESSLSDIIAVVFFNFLLRNHSIHLNSVAQFGLEVVAMVIISFIATLVLALLLQKVEHQIKYVPIILLVVLIYTISKMYHLPSLLFILLFGVVLGNLDELKK